MVSSTGCDSRFWTPPNAQPQQCHHREYHPIQPTLAHGFMASAVLAAQIERIEMPGFDRFF
jgi:hypothetical protein